MFYFQIFKSLKVYGILKRKKVLSIPCEYRIFDIEYFFEVAKNNDQFSNIEVETSIPCLVVNEPGDDYDSYLGVFRNSIGGDIWQI